MPFQLNAAAASLCATSSQQPCPLARARMIAAREPGRDSEAVLRDVLGYDPARIEALRRSGALG